MPQWMERHVLRPRALRAAPDTCPPGRGRVWHVSPAGQAPEPLDVEGQVWRFCLVGTTALTKALNLKPSCSEPPWEDVGEGTRALPMTDLLCDL